MKPTPNLATQQDPAFEGQTDKFYRIYGTDPGMMLKNSSISNPETPLKCVCRMFTHYNTQELNYLSQTFVMLDLH